MYTNLSEKNLQIIVFFVLHPILTGSQNFPLAQQNHWNAVDTNDEEKF